MGKEAKIGLAVVGGLMLVFVALLIRRFVPLEAMMTGAAPSISESAEAGNSGVTPTVLAVHNDSQNDTVHDSSAEMPRREFMPPGQPPSGGGQSHDRYDGDERFAVRGGDIPASDSNPFNRATALPNPQAIADRQGHPQRRPIQRLNAELTDDEIPPAAESDAAPDHEPELNSIEVPSVSDEATAPPLDTDAPAEPVAEQAPPTVPVDISARPQSRYQEPAEVPAEEPRQLVDNGKYTIQPNDNLWLISEKVYGNGRYFKAIYQHNRNKLPRADQLTVGTVIAVPPASVLEENYPALCPKQRKSVMVQPRGAVPASTHPRAASGGDVYTVEAGDTLFDIARYELGKASRWNEIYELNRDVLGDDFDYIQPGTQLRMPPRPQREVIAREPDHSYQR